VRSRSFAVIAGIAATFVATRARAEAFDDPYDLPDAPRPPVLPELTHPDLEATIESTLGVLTPRAGAPQTPDCDVCSSRFAYVQRIGVEIPLSLRRVFVGANYEGALGGRHESGSDTFVGSNLELYGRTVWATRTGLAFGGGLGVIVPTAAFDDGSPAASVAHSAASLRPWDTTLFTHGVFAVRPFVDVRDIVGPLVIHFRQGLDIVADVGDPSSRRLLAITGLYLGYRVSDHLGAGIEAFETYTVDAPIDDRLRATFVVSPSIRVMTPYVQPAISGFTNIGAPLYGWSDRIIGVRVAVTLVYDATTQTIERGTPGHGM
jgi:hypothetical protein